MSFDTPDGGFAGNFIQIRQLHICRPVGTAGGRLDAVKKRKYLTIGGPMGYKVTRIITNFYLSQLRHITVKP
jgi:hypothetical protein